MSSSDEDSRLPRAKPFLIRNEDDTPPDDTPPASAAPPQLPRAKPFLLSDDNSTDDDIAAEHERLVKCLQAMKSDTSSADTRACFVHILANTTINLVVAAILDRGTYSHNYLVNLGDSLVKHLSIASQVHRERILVVFAKTLELVSEMGNPMEALMVLAMIASVIARSGPETRSAR